VSPIDVLKVAHHGSKTSTTAEWLLAWKPRMAVISVGEHNVYGHPNPQVLDRLKGNGARVYRTDMEGEVQMSIHDGVIGIKTKLVE
jgi:competence protein ComEC